MSRNAVPSLNALRLTSVLWKNGNGRWLKNDNLRGRNKQRKRCSYEKNIFRLMGGLFTDILNSRSRGGCSGSIGEEVGKRGGDLSVNKGKNIATMHFSRLTGLKIRIGHISVEPNSHSVRGLSMKILRTCFLPEWR